MLSESNNELIINGNMFKRIDDVYYIDAYGNVYSKVINSYMRHEITHSGHIIEFSYMVDTTLYID